MNQYHSNLLATNTLYPEKKFEPYSPKVPENGKTTTVYQCMVRLSTAAIQHAQPARNVRPTSGRQRYDVGTSYRCRPDVGPLFHASWVVTLF